MLMTEAPEDRRAVISAKKSTAVKLRMLVARMVVATGRRVTVDEVLGQLIDGADESTIARRLGRR